MSNAHVYALGVMIVPLEQAFGWSRVQISSGLLIASVIAVTCAPFMGMAIDRFGPRRVVLLGLCLYSIAVGGLSLATTSIWSWWALWVFLAVAHLHIKPTAWVTAISSVFSSTRGLALGTLLSVAGIGAIITPAITVFLLETFGWRLAYVLLVACWGVVVIPLVFFLFWSPKDKRRGGTSQLAETDQRMHEGVQLHEGYSTPVFYRFAAAAFLMSAGTMALVVNLVPIMTSLGRPLETAAAVAGLLGVMQLVGRLSGGFLMDRINARLVVGFAAAMPAISGLLLLSFPGSLIGLICAVLVLGLATGAENDGLAYLSARYFGLRNFGALFGTCAGMITLGLGVGPVLASYGYDLRGSYDLVLWCIIPISLVNAYLFLSAGPYPSFDKSESSTGQVVQPSQVG